MCMLVGCLVSLSIARFVCAKPSPLVMFLCSGYFLSICNALRYVFHAHTAKHVIIAHSQWSRFSTLTQNVCLFRFGLVQELGLCSVSPDPASQPNGSPEQKWRQRRNQTNVNSSSTSRASSISKMQCNGWEFVVRVLQTMNSHLNSPRAWHRISLQYGGGGFFSRFFFFLSKLIFSL